MTEQNKEPQTTHGSEQDEALNKIEFNKNGLKINGVPVQNLLCKWKYHYHIEHKPNNTLPTIERN